MQISWLAASDPIINWTLPEPHRFSLPGWYHAAFLVVTATAIGTASLVLARRLRRATVSVLDEVAYGRSAAAFLGPRDAHRNAPSTTPWTESRRLPCGW